MTLRRRPRTKACLLFCLDYWGEAWTNEAMIKFNQNSSHVWIYGAKLGLVGRSLNLWGEGWTNGVKLGLMRSLVTTFTLFLARVVRTKVSNCAQAT